MLTAVKIIQFFIRQKIMREVNNFIFIPLKKTYDKRIAKTMDSRF